MCRCCEVTGAELVAALRAVRCCRSDALRAARAMMGRSCHGRFLLAGDRASGAGDHGRRPKYGTAPGETTRLATARGYAGWRRRRNAEQRREGAERRAQTVRRSWRWWAAVPPVAWPRPLRGEVRACCCSTARRAGRHPQKQCVHNGLGCTASAWAGGAGTRGARSTRSRRRARCVLAGASVTSVVRPSRDRTRNRLRGMLWCALKWWISLAQRRLKRADL